MGYLKQSDDREARYQTALHAVLPYASFFLPGVTPEAVANDIADDLGTLDEATAVERFGQRLASRPDYFDHVVGRALSQSEVAMSRREHHAHRVQSGACRPNGRVVGHGHGLGTQPMGGNLRRLQDIFSGLRGI